MKKILSASLLLLAICFAWYPSTSFAKQLHIAMVLWRGITDAEKGFQSRLTELGYPTEYTIFNADQDKKQLASVLRKDFAPRIEEFDYVYSFGTTASHMTKLVNSGRIPHIFNIVTDPVKANIAESMDSAGRNTCGISHRISLELQIENGMKLKHIDTLAFLFNPREKNSNIIREELKVIADQYGFNLMEFRAPPGNNMLERNLSKIEESAAAIDAVYLPLDSYLVSQSEMIGNSLKNAKIISIGAQKEYIQSGVLIGLIPDYYQLGEESAILLDRHLKGERLQDIPVQTVKNPTFIINKTTMDVLNVAIPQEIFNQAIILE